MFRKILIFLFLFIPIAHAQSSKVITIVNYEIVAAETWEQALDISTEFENEATASAVQKWWVKAQENDDTDVAFDYAFDSEPGVGDSYGTNGGQGFAMNGVSLKDLWVRARDATTIIEIAYFH